MLIFMRENVYMIIPAVLLAFTHILHACPTVNLCDGNTDNDLRNKGLHELAKEETS